MVAGSWNNQDGLYLQFGTSKAIPEIAGEYRQLGNTREIEQLVPLVPYQLTSAGVAVPAPAQTTFSGTTTAAAAGIQSVTSLLPLQLTAPVITTTGGSIVLSNTQIMIEQVEVEGLITAAGGTSVSIGLAFDAPGSPTSTFTQVTPNPGVQIINALLTANIVAGAKIIYTQPGSTGLRMDTATLVAGGGTWVGTQMPLVTNVVTPLPSSAYLSTVNTGTFTNGLFKLRIRYTLYGNISF